MAQDAGDAVPTETPRPPAAAAGPAAAPAPSDALNEPPLAQLGRGLVKPRFAAFSRTSARLQNVVLRLCSLERRSPRDLEVGYVRTMRAASAAVSLAFASEYNRAASTSVLTPFGEEAIARTQFNVLLGSAPDGPATLAALRNLEPGYVGLPALEYALFHLEDDEGRCPLAVTLAAHVANTARTLERRWDKGHLDPQWSEPETEQGARRRLFDLLAGMLRTLGRTVDVLSPRPRGASGQISFSEPANAAFVQGRLAALTDMARVVNAYAMPGTDAQTATATLVQNLAALSDRSAELRATPSRTTVAAMTTQLSAVQRYVQTDVAEAFGFAPEALDPLMLDRVAPAGGTGSR